MILPNIYCLHRLILFGFLAHLSRRLIGEFIVLVGLRPRLHSFNISYTGPTEVKYHMELLWDGRMKVCSNGPGHMIKIGAMSIYGKNLAKITESWYTASSTTKFVQMMTTGWPFYAKVRFGSVCFCMGKRLRLNSEFLRNYCSLWSKSWYVL